MEALYYARCEALGQYYIHDSEAYPFEEALDYARYSAPELYYAHYQET